MVTFDLDEAVGSDGPLGLNYIANMLTNDSGGFSLAESNLSVVIALEGGEIVISVSQLNISGLNTWKDFNVLNAGPNHTLISTADIGKLSIDIQFSLNLTFPSLGPALSETGIFRAHFTNGLLNSTFQLGIFAISSTCF